MADQVGGGKAGVRMEVLWIAIYCANPKPNPGSQSGSQSHRGLGRQALWIMWEYEFVTTILIWPLIHPRMCEMGSSI